jgi:hypothetical protein
MTDEGSSVTLIFYRINPKWWTEPALNLASAVAQMSNLTHCEISIGEEKPALWNTRTHTDAHLDPASLLRRRPGSTGRP